jgi:hypothetical protein
MLSIEKYGQIAAEIRFQADELARLAKAFGIVGNEKIRGDLYSRSFILKDLAKQLDATTSIDVQAIVKAADGSAAATVEAAIGKGSFND